MPAPRIETPEVTNGDGTGRRFAAFISYSHADDRIARWLHRRLEQFAIPSGIAPGRGSRSLLGRRIGKVFRDREEFPAGGELSSRIEHALAGAGHLLVLCSPRSAASRFVDREIRFFESMGGADRVIPVIVEGDPPACFPPALRAGPERLGADLRDGKDGKDSGLIKIISGLLDVEPDDLFQRQRRRQRWILGLMSAVAAVFAVVAVVAVLQTREAGVQRSAAEANAKRARENEASAEFQRQVAVANAASAAANAAEAERNAAEARRQQSRASESAALAEQRAEAERQQRHRAEDALAKVFTQRALDVASTPPSRVRYALAGLTLFPEKERDLHLALGVALQDQDRLLTSAESSGITPIWLRTGPAVIYRGRSGELLASPTVPGTRPRVLTEPLQEVRAMALSPDEQGLAVAEADGALRLVNPETGRLVWKEQLSLGAIWSVSFSPDGAWIAISGDNGKAEIRHAVSGAPAQILSPDRLALYRISFARSGRLVATASHSGEAQIWRTADGRLMHRLVGHRDRLRDLLFLGDGTRLATASMDGTIRIWDAESGVLLRTIEAHADWVDALAADRNGSLLMSGSTDRTAKVWNTADGTLRVAVPAFQGPVYGVALDARGMLAAAASADGTALLVDVETGRVLSRLRAHEGGPVYSVAFSEDGSKLLTSGATASLRLWDARPQQLTRSAASDGVIERRSVRATVDRGVVFVDDGGKVRLIDVGSRQTLRMLEGHMGPVVHVAVSPDTDMVATASQDHTARVWDRRSGRLISILRGHVFPLELVALSPDGRLAATASRDGTVRLWHSASGRELQRWETGVRWMEALGFTAAGDGIRTEGEGRSFGWSIERLNWSLNQAVAFACTEFLRPQQRVFTMDERENDPLVRETWAQGRDSAVQDVCVRANARLASGASPDSRRRYR